MRIREFTLASALLMMGALPTAVAIPSSVHDGVIETSALKAEVDAFFDREIAAHFSAISDEGPLPERVHGALTTGEFSWAAFAR